MKWKRVLFACVANSGRSQMAEAFAKQHWKGSLIFESAGTDPADRVNPLVAKVLEEKGINMGSRTPRRLTEDMYEASDRVIPLWDAQSKTSVQPCTYVPKIGPLMILKERLWKKSASSGMKSREESRLCSGPPKNTNVFERII